MATTASPGTAPVARSPLVPALVVAAVGLLAGLLVSHWLLLLVLVAPGVAYVLRWQGQQAAEAARLRQVQELAAAEERALAERAELLADEHTQLRASALDPRALQEAVQSGTSVWAAQGELLVRVGTGDLPARSVRDAVLTDVPVTVSLSAAGVLGLGGTGARGLARWLVLQAAVQRSPADLSVWLLTDPERTGRDAEWGWLRSLPHNAGTPERCVRLIGATEASLAARIAELQALVAHRTAMASEPDGPLGPDVLVIVDSANTIRSLPGVPALLGTGQSAGVLFLCIAELSGALPAECRVTASLSPEGLELKAGDAAALIVVPDSLDAARADRLAAALPEAAATPPDPLPASVRLLDLLAVEPPDAATISRRWGQSLPVLLGSGEKAPLPLDLDAGPVLVAGAVAEETAAVLRTAVAALALSLSPKALSVVLLTQTEALSGCAELPHVVNALADPDAAMASRVLASLGAELERREQALAAVAATDINAYLAAGHRALPRLLLVVEEISALLPDLRDGLLALAGRGAPLGVHLLVGTSSASALANELLHRVGQRLVLRMASASDSRRALGTAASSWLLEGAAGRGYARLGDGPLQPFQAASVDGRPVTPKPVPTAWDELGLPAPMAQGSGPTDLARIVSAMGQFAADRGPSPWLEELPATVALDSLASDAAGLSWIPWGLEDRPRKQAHAPAAWDLEHGGHLLVIGARESGRSTLLRTLAASLAERAAAADVHLYALDGGDALASLASLPHCGAVVTTREPERAERLLARLAAEVSRRQRQLADRGFDDLASQRAGTADPLPYLVLVVDAWERFVEAHGWVDDGPLHDTLVDVLRDGAAVGVRVVLSGDRTLLASDLAALVTDRVALRLDDHADYGVAGLNQAAVPVQVRAGRGFRAAGDVVNAVQIAVLPGDVGSAGQNAAVQELAAALPPARGRKPFRVDVLPARIGLAEALELAPSGPGAAFAVGGDELRLQTVNLAACGPGFTISGPAASGRSTALLVLARSLLEAGTQLCLVLPKASPLTALAEAEGVVLVADVRDPSRLSAVLSHTNGRVAILIDDADQVTDDRWDTVLLEVLKTAVSKDHAVVVAADQDWLAGADAGFAVEAQRSRSGLLLTPDSPERGELLGVRLARSAVFTGPPGRGVLLRSGQPMAVQVPLFRP